MDQPGSKWCFHCQSNVAVEQFGKKRGVLKSWCKACCNQEERTRRLRPKVKKAHKEYCATEDQKVKRQTRDKTPAGRVVQHRANHTDAGKQRQKRYSDGPKAVIRKKRYRQSDKGIDARRRDYAKHYAKPANRVSTLLGNLLRKTINGKHHDGSSSIKRTGLSSGREVLCWLMDTAPDDLDPAKPWHIDHIIPRKEYDHTDDEDIDRCWNYRNLRAVTKLANLKKGARLYASLIQSVPVDYWPKEWAGVCPV